MFLCGEYDAYRKKNRSSYLHQTPSSPEGGVASATSVFNFSTSPRFCFISRTILVCEREGKPSRKIRGEVVTQIAV